MSTTRVLACVAGSLKCTAIRTRTGAVESFGFARLRPSRGVGEAKLIALRLSKPPAGFGHWKPRLLADLMVEPEVVESISPETVRQTPKKNGMTKRKIENWVIPPDADGEFVANLEEVLETYERAYDPDCEGKGIRTLFLKRVLTPFLPHAANESSEG